jgi:hypothetical protein
MSEEKRKNRGYKIVDSQYAAAMKKSIDVGIPLANMIEEAVRYHGEGYKIVAIKGGARMPVNYFPSK